MALSIFLKEIRNIFRDCEKTLSYIVHKFPPENPCLAYVDESKNRIISGNPKPFSLKNFLNDSILWAAPKHRRTLEKRWKRKYGFMQHFYKMLQVRTDLLVCNHCGHDYQKGHLCRNCYTKVKRETIQMQARIVKQLGLEPINQEVIVLYKGEKESQPDEFYEGKRIIEMKKERPAWFSRNLLQRSTAEPSKSTDIKPEHLA